MRKMYSAIAISAAIALSMTGCATNNDGVRTNQYHARSMNNGNGLGMNGLGTNGADNANLNGTRNRALDNYNNNYGTNRSYHGMGSTSGNTGMFGTNGSNGMNGMNGTNNVRNNQPNAYNKEVSQKIAKHVSSIKGVDKATVVVYGKDVIVGLDVKGGTNTFALTNDVRKAVRDVEPGYNVHVTTDNNLHTQIRNLNTDLTPNGADGFNGMQPLDGHPVRNFATDVGELINDMGRAITAPFR